jgi:hypothetical protein
MRLILAALCVALSSQAIGQDAPVPVAAPTPAAPSVSAIAAHQFVAQVVPTDPQCSRSPLVAQRDISSVVARRDIPIPSVVARLRGQRESMSILDASVFSRTLVQPPTN